MYLPFPPPLPSQCGDPLNSSHPDDSVTQRRNDTQAGRHARGWGKPVSKEPTIFPFVSRKISQRAGKLASPSQKGNTFILEAALGPEGLRSSMTLRPGAHKLGEAEFSLGPGFLQRFLGAKKDVISCQRAVGLNR